MLLLFLDSRGCQEQVRIESGASLPRKDFDQGTLLPSWHLVSVSQQ